MKILFIHNHYQQAGGEDTVVEQEIAVLKRSGHDVRLYARPNSESKGLFRLLLAPFSAVWSSRSAKDIDRILHDFKADIMHVHNTWFTISPSVYWAAKKHRIPVVQTLHNYRLFCPAATFFRSGRVCEDCAPKAFAWPGVIHRCYRGSFWASFLAALTVGIHRMLGTWRDKINPFIALSEFCKKKFIECGIPGDKIVVKPNFVVPDPGISGKTGDYALFVGRLTAEKGIRTLLKALPELKGIPLKIVGAGPLAEEVENSVRSLNSDDVEILGQKSREEVIELIKECRFLIFPSEWYECFPIIIAEAFACGKPVVVSRIGSALDIVEEGKAGIFFEPGNAADLARKIQWMFDHPSECAAMGRRARDVFEEKYSEKQNICALTDIYKTAITRSKVKT